MKVSFTVFIALGVMQSVTAVHNILDYGAVQNADGKNITAAMANGKAIYDAVVAANATDSTDRTVLVPDYYFGHLKGGDIVIGGDEEGERGYDVKPLIAQVAAVAPQERERYHDHIRDSMKAELVAGKSNLTRGVFVYVPHAEFDNLQNVTIILDSVISLWQGDNLDLWPNKTDAAGQPVRYGKSGYLLDSFYFKNGNQIRFTSNNQKGAIDGHGYRWWIASVFSKANRFRNNDRPLQFAIHGTTQFHLSHISIFDPPYAQVNCRPCSESTFTFISSHVSLFGENSQSEVLQRAGKWDYNLRLPMFPLNTGMLLIGGRNNYVSNIYGQCFDDVLCAKPDITMEQREQGGPCASNLTFENSLVVNGLGATVGSVSSDHQRSCIKDAVFRNIHFKEPIKAIYLKYNPQHNRTCEEASGLIDSISYENITGTGALLWAIDVGMQQIHEPGSKGGACSFFYPLPGHKCATNPCFPINNLKLKNVQFEDALLSAGLLLCSNKTTAQCSGWEWEDVHFGSKSKNPWPVHGGNFLCSGLVNASFTNVTPACSPPPENRLDFQ